ncbi:MAG: hypothetical protein AAF235_11725 [Planctomycetota bacterium]
MSTRGPTGDMNSGRSRRGVALALVVTLLAFIQLATVATLGAASDDAWTAGARVRTLRAFFAAEGAFNAAASAIAEGETVSAGTVTFGVRQEFELVTVPDLMTGGVNGGDLVIEGRSDSARRVATIEIR